MKVTALLALLLVLGGCSGSDEPEGCSSAISASADYLDVLDRTQPGATVDEETAEDMAGIRERWETVSLVADGDLRRTADGAKVAAQSLSQAAAGSGSYNPDAQKVLNLAGQVVDELCG